MLNANFPQELINLDEAYRNAESNDGDLPDGRYIARVEKVEPKHSQAGSLMLSWVLVIMGPHSEGRKVFKNSMLTDNGIPWTKKELELCGLHLEKISDLPNRMEELLDITLSITVKHKDDNTNIYFNKKLETPKGDVVEQNLKVF